MTYDINLQSHTFVPFVQHKNIAEVMYLTSAYFTNEQNILSLPLLWNTDLAPPSNACDCSKLKEVI